MEQKLIKYYEEKVIENRIRSIIGNATFVVKRKDLIKFLKDNHVTNKK